MINMPTGLSRREIYIDARDLQSDSDPDDPLTPEEYAAVLTTRGRGKLTEHQLVRSFAATVRERDATYTLGEDYKLGDTITVIDETLDITADAVVQGVTRSIGRDGETMELILGYSQPTAYDILKRKADR